MSGTLVDSNVLLDIVTADPIWLPWSREQLRDAGKRGAIVINPIIHAEVAPAFASAHELDRWLSPVGLIRAALPYSAGWLAAQAFVKYRKSGGIRSTPLPDFYIGAHAEVEKLTLLTRDAARYRTYFPGISLIAPP